MNNTDWMSNALCAEIGGDFFILDKGDSSVPAKKICADCPVRTACLQYALDTDQDTGIWGGLSGQERRALRRTAA